MLQVTHSRLLRYGVAVFAVGSALLLMLLLDPWATMTKTPFLLFFGAVMVSAWYGGIESGLLATVLSALVSTYFFTILISDLGVDLNACVRLLLFIVQGILFSALCERLHTTNQQLEISLRKLRENESRFRRVVESNMIGIFFSDFNNAITEANDAFLKTVGYTREELASGRVRWDVMTPPEYQSLDERAINQLKTSGVCPAYEKEYIHKDGSRIPILLGAALMQEARQDSYTVGFVVDLSERKRAEESVQQLANQLQEQANTLNTILSTSVDHIYVFDQSGRYQYVSDGGAKVLGFQPSEVIGKSWRELGLSADIMEQVDAQREQVIATGKPLKSETIFVTSEGVQYYEYILTPLRQNSEQIEAVVAVSRDITERKQAEEALKESQQLFESFMKYSPTIAFIKDEAGRFIYVSPRLELTSNRPQADWLGKTAFDFFPAEIAQQWQDNDTAVLDQGQAIEFLETSKLEDGTHYWLSFKFPLQDAFGQKLLGGILLDITERKRIEEERTQLLVREQAARKEAEEAREQVSKILESITDGFLAFDREWRFRYLNHEGARTLGHLPEELLGKNLWEELPELRNTSFGQLYLRAMAEGVTLELEDYYPPFDAWFAVRVYPSEVGLSLYFRNITERKQAESALKDSEERFRKFFEEAPIGISVVDLEGRFLRVNHAYSQMLGYSEAELLGCSFVEITHPEDAELDVNWATRMSSGEIPGYQLEKRYIKKNGETVWVNLTSSMISEQEGRVRYGIGMVEDITQRKQAQQALRQSEERYRSLVAVLTSVVWTTNAEGEFVEPQLSWQAYTGQSWEEHQGWGWTQSLHPDDREQVQALWTQALTERTIYKSEGRIWNANSRQYHYYVARGVPLLNPDGSVREWIGTVTDVNEQKQAEGEIRQLTETLEERVKQRTAQLEAANQELESFSYSVSHDLRAPLRHISGFVDLLQKRVTDTQLDDTSQRYLRTIAQTAKHAGTLVDDLLAFSRMGRAEMRYTTLNMDQLVKEVQRDIQLETDGRAFSWWVAPLPEVPGDPSMVRLVLRNLVDNAIKYTRTRETAEVEIGSYETEREVIFFVRDNGVGFDMRYVHKLFGVFQRLHTTDEFEGTGIGLANVRRIIHRHGGRTWAEGIVDGGATFYFSLPKVAEQELKVGG